MDTDFHKSQEQYILEECIYLWWTILDKDIQLSGDSKMKMRKGSFYLRGC